MTILFLHGWQSVPGGIKPTCLPDHGHTVINPKLPDEDFDESVRIAQAEFEKHQPQIIVKRQDWLKKILNGTRMQCDDPHVQRKQGILDGNCFLARNNEPDDYRILDNAGSLCSRQVGHR